jgi:hypothetical protein
VVVDATVLGVPVRAPVDVLKLIPGGVVLIAKLEMAPPVDELTVNPVAAEFTVLLSDDEDKVNTGGSMNDPDVITRLVPLLLTATNKPAPYVTESHWLATAGVRIVQLSPFELVITRGLGPA